VYVYVFGDGIPHLHLHLAPHRKGDPLNDQVVRGEVVQTRLPNGATAVVSRDFPELPPKMHEKVRERFGVALSKGSGEA